MKFGFARRTLATSASIVFMALLACSAVSAKVAAPDPTVDDSLGAKSGQQTVVLSGGCFWGIQLVFEHVKGVIDVKAGYSGGSAQTATYPVVSSGTTGHAESVKIVYDPTRITYGQLLKVFFSVAHDPTQLNRQYPDEGTQYRSAIFYGDPDQQRIAQAYIAQMNQAKVFGSKIVTQVVPLQAFYQAEGYHQDFAIHNPLNPYIRMFDLPKLDDLRKTLPALYVEKR
jgi:peptide-methionine (S)-S-oxide reductase